MSFIDDMIGAVTGAVRKGAEYAKGAVEAVRNALARGDIKGTENREPEINDMPRATDETAQAFMDAVEAEDAKLRNGFYTTEEDKQLYMDNLLRIGQKAVEKIKELKAVVDLIQARTGRNLYAEAGLAEQGVEKETTELYRFKVMFHVHVVCRQGQEYDMAVGPNIYEGTMDSIRSQIDRYIEGFYNQGSGQYKTNVRCSPEEISVREEILSKTLLTQRGL